VTSIPYWQKLQIGNTVASAQREVTDRIDWLDPACVDRHA
jgi:hypothetical protein